MAATRAVDAVIIAGAADNLFLPAPGALALLSDDGGNHGGVKWIHDL
jgi:hypothetical protein